MAQSADSMDCYTMRPRTPNDQYTLLTDEQIKNISQDPSPFFHTKKPDKGVAKMPREGGRFYMDRFVDSTNKHLVRQAGADRYCWINEKFDRNIPEEYNTCRAGASVRWGPRKAGERTRSHFFGEQIDRYTTIDMYRRPATNIPGPVAMDCGRPGEGYYAPRHPTRVTWFGSSVPLNRTKILPSVGKKTTAQYAQIDQSELEFRQQRKGEWPEYSEYTDKFLLHSKVSPRLTGLEEKKRHIAMAAAST